MRFLVTSELARLGRWLRALGFDTVITQDHSARRLALLCRLQDRILLTRIFRQAGVAGIPSYTYIRSDELTEQLSQVINTFDLQDFNLFSRCIYCNRKVQMVSKTEIEHRLPEQVQELYQNFTSCPSCGRIYWEGTHCEAIRKTMEQLSGNRFGTKSS